MYVAALFLQIPMNVWLTLMAVTKSVLTPLDRFSAAALMGTHSLLMENHVQIPMNVLLAHITASNSVSISMEDFYVAVTQATSSTPMEETVLVILLC